MSAENERKCKTMIRMASLFSYELESLYLEQGLIPRGKKTTKTRRK